MEAAELKIDEVDFFLGRVPEAILKMEIAMTHTANSVLLQFSLIIFPGGVFQNLFCHLDRQRILASEAFAKPLSNRLKLLYHLNHKYFDRPFRIGSEGKNPPSHDHRCVYRKSYLCLWIYIGNNKRKSLGTS